MCAAHHVTDWAKGGPTDINNLTLACDHCHALINDGPGGWKTVVMGKDSPYRGRTGWIAPKSVDPTGTPRVERSPSRWAVDRGCNRFQLSKVALTGRVKPTLHTSLCVHIDNFRVLVPPHRADPRPSRNEAGR
ncbi:HNH endonuclease [Nocardia tengchongensis]|uniref:HNH endonuclease n=1 Tax=Nocardia tengchongensis TaxID=2055889 RepID=A0ABX8CUN2_9NOCA|nr:HNH endonuclease [Nocardia tengchongensis]